jgi:hypothetical protein
MSLHREVSPKFRPDGAEDSVGLSHTYRSSKRIRLLIVLPSPQFRPLRPLDFSL